MKRGARNLAPALPEGAGEKLPCGCVRYVSQCWEAQRMWLRICDLVQLEGARSGGPGEAEYLQLHAQYKAHRGIE